MSATPRPPAFAAAREATFFAEAETLLDAPYVRVLFRECTKTLVTHWLGFASVADYRATLEAALVFGRARGVRRWVGHNKHMRVIAPNEQRWTADAWWPRFARLPIERLAVVVADDAFNRLAIERILVRASDSTPFDTRYVRSFEDALAWFEGSLAT